MSRYALATALTAVGIGISITAVYAAHLLLQFAAWVTRWALAARTVLIERTTTLIDSRTGAMPGEDTPTNREDAPVVIDSHVINLGDYQRNR